VVQGCNANDILQRWCDDRLEFPGLSDLARNAFCIMATSSANQRVFSVDGHVNGRKQIEREVNLG